MDRPPWTGSLHPCRRFPWRPQPGHARLSGWHGARPAPFSHLFALRVGLQPIVWQYGDSPTAATPAAGHGRQRRDGRGGRSLLGAPPHARHLADRRCPLCAAHACTGRPSGLLGPHVASRPPVQFACIITCKEVAPNLGVLHLRGWRASPAPCLLPRPLAPAAVPAARARGLLVYPASQNASEAHPRQLQEVAINLYRWSCVSCSASTV